MPTTGSSTRSVNPRPFDIANQWAGSLGGPIKKDKLFFFFDTEGLRLVIPNLSDVQIPSPQFEAATIANIDSPGLAQPPQQMCFTEKFSVFIMRRQEQIPLSPAVNPDDPTGLRRVSDKPTD